MASRIVVVNKVVECQDKSAVFASSASQVRHPNFGIELDA